MTATQYQVPPAVLPRTGLSIALACVDRILRRPGVCNAHADTLVFLRDTKRD